MFKKILLRIGVVVAILLALPLVVWATHSWGGYHWARSSNPFTLQLGDNVSSVWDSYLATTATDWSASSVLDTIVAAGGTSAKRCRPTSGRVEVCNYRYGYNGWLGLAQIWVSGSHIVQGITKMNDNYFSLSTYNTPAWKNLVMCQEVGHTLGLDHQDETFNNPNLGTCMDYTSNPLGPPSNEHPNQHDYAMLEEIYSHLDSFTSVKSGKQKLPPGKGNLPFDKDEEFENRSDWGKELKNNKRVALYERDFGGGNKLFTFVVWQLE